MKDKQGRFAGTYQKASGLKNKRSYWNKIDGGDALWYVIGYNVWMIGSSSDLGSNGGNIASKQDAACPTSNNLFQWGDGVKFHLAPINSVSIQCV